MGNRQAILIINPAVGCRCCPPRLQIPCQSQGFFTIRPVLAYTKQGHIGVNNLPMVTALWHSDAGNLLSDCGDLLLLPWYIVMSGIYHAYSRELRFHV